MIGLGLGNSILVLMALTRHLQACHVECPKAVSFFLIYVSDIGNASLKVPVRLFADDTNLFIFGKNVSHVENRSVHSMSLLSDWFVSNKLSLNLAKTCYMSFYTCLLYTSDAADE